MKKTVLFIGLLCAFVSVSAQFVPKAGLFYNIIDLNTSLVIGPILSSGQLTATPALMTPTNDVFQAFQFIPVSGKPNTYNVVNGTGKYFTQWVDNSWNTKFESAANERSEWVITGTDSLSLLFENWYRKNLPANCYLGVDGAASSGSELYADKGTPRYFMLVKAQAKFAILDTLPIQLESSLGKSYPLYLSAFNQSYNIDVTPSAGISVSKTICSPSDFINGQIALAVSLPSSSPLAVGSTGKVVFSYTEAGVTYKLDSIKVSSVAAYTRYFIKHKSSNYYLGTSSSRPGLTDKVSDNDPNQQFILRPVNPGVSDGLYYIIQNNQYNFLKKSDVNDWDAEYGMSTVGSIWKIADQSNGTTKITNNSVTKDLGTDAITLGSSLYYNKAFTADATSSPYCEWIFQQVGAITGLNESATVKLFATVENNNVLIHGSVVGDEVKVYNTSGQLLKQFKAKATVETIQLKSGIYIIKVNTKIMKVVL